MTFAYWQKYLDDVSLLFCVERCREDGKSPAKMNCYLCLLLGSNTLAYNLFRALFLVGKNPDTVRNLERNSKLSVSSRLTCYSSYDGWLFKTLEIVSHDVNKVPA